VEYESETVGINAGESPTHGNSSPPVFQENFVQYELAVETLCSRDINIDVAGFSAPARLLPVGELEENILAGTSTYKFLEGS
jgi:hypothetical protein